MGGMCPMSPRGRVWPYRSVAAARLARDSLADGTVFPERWWTVCGAPARVRARAAATEGRAGARTRYGEAAPSGSSVSRRRQRTPCPAEALRRARPADPEPRQAPHAVCRARLECATERPALCRAVFVMPADTECAHAETRCGGVRPDRSGPGGRGVGIRRCTARYGESRETENGGLSLCGSSGSLRGSRSSPRIRENGVAPAGSRTVADREPPAPTQLGSTPGRTPQGPTAQWRS